MESQQAPTGSLADVRGMGVHDGATWSLEMSRTFDTGHPDDAVIDPSRDNPCCSVKANAESAPPAKRGRYFRFCSSVPKYKSG